MTQLVQEVIVVCAIFCDIIPAGSLKTLRA